MANNDPEWTFVERNDGVEEKPNSKVNRNRHVPSEVSSSDDDTDQEFEVVKKGFSPPNFPLLKMTENYYGTDTQDDGSDIEIIKPLGAKGFTSADDQADDWTLSGDDDWFRYGFQGNFQDDDDSDDDDWLTFGFQGDFHRSDSEDELYGLAELFECETPETKVAPSGVLCDLDWQPRSRTSPFLVLILLGVTTGIFIIGNTSVMEIPDSTASRKLSSLDVILLSARLNASTEKFDKLRSMYTGLERSHSSLQKRLESVSYFAQIMRGRSLKQDRQIRLLERLLDREQTALRRCQDKYLALINSKNNTTEHGYSSVKECVSAVMGSLPRLNLTAFTSSDSSTEHFLQRIATRVANAKGKVDQKITKLNNKITTTWRQLFGKLRGEKAKHDADSEADAYVERGHDVSRTNRFRRIFSMSNIIGGSSNSNRHSVHSGEETHQFCHLKDGDEEFQRKFKQRWSRPEPSNLPALTYPMPLDVGHGGDFVSSRAERNRALVDWPQHEAVEVIEDTEEDAREAAKEASDRDIVKTRQELQLERARLEKERLDFEAWKSAENKKLKKAKKKMRRQHQERVEGIKAFASKLRRTYDRKASRANRKLIKKYSKVEKRLKKLRDLLATMLQRRFEELRRDGSAEAERREEWNRAEETYQGALRVRDEQISKQESQIVHFKALYHELEVRMDVLQRLHKNLRSKYNTLKEKQMQSYEDLVFHKKSTALPVALEDPLMPDAELENWIPTVWCPDLNGCRSLFTVNPRDQVTWYHPDHSTCDGACVKKSAVSPSPRTLSIPVTAKASTQQRTAKIRPSKPTTNIKFSLFQPYAPCSSKLSSSMEGNETMANQQQQQQQRKDSETRSRVDWYSSWMQEREEKSALPLSWYLYWAKGRDNYRSETEKTPSRSQGVDWYTAMMRDRDHQRKADAEASWYFDWMRGRSDERHHDPQHTTTYHYSRRVCM